MQNFGSFYFHMQNVHMKYMKISTVQKLFRVANLQPCCGNMHDAMHWCFLHA